MSNPNINYTNFDPRYLPKQVPSQISTSNIAQIYDVERNLYNWHASNTRRFRTALGEANFSGSICRIAATGDSQVGGTGSVPATESWPRILSDRIGAYGIPVASGEAIAFAYKESAQDARYMYSSGWMPNTFNVPNAQACAFLSCNATNPLSYTSVKAGSVVEVAYVNSGSNFTVAIDGGSAVTVTVPDVGNNVQFYRVAGLANTTHNVVITPLASSNVHIYWIDVRGTTGVSILNAGLGGSRAQGWASGLFYACKNMVTAWQPHLVTIGLGTNDLIAGRTKVQFKSDLASLITSFQSNSDVLITTPFNISGYDFTEYRSAIYELADSLDVPVVDFGDRYGSYATANSLGIMSDSYHVKRRVNADAGSCVASTLLL